MQPEQLGRYRINGVLGRGGMGVVYEGHDPQIDRVVAIKTIALDELSEEGKSIFESRFRAEMRSAGRLQHHNIVALYDTGRDGGTAYIVMERVHGQDLKRHLASGVRFSVEQSVDLVLQLLSALEFAHRHDVIHRDVKPANVMLQSDGVIKLCDFGVARLNDADATRTQGMVVGSLRYSSPEQVSGLPVDARTDVFAAGVLLFELLTHRLPFEGGSDVESLYRIAHQQAPSPRSVDASIPPEIDSAVARALAKDPKDRFANAAEFAIALGGSSVRRADTTSPRPPMPAGVASGALAAATVPPGRATYATVTEGAAAPQPGGRRAWVAAVVVGVLVAVFGGLYYVLRPGRVPEAVAGRQAVPASTPSAVAAVATTAPVPPATFTTSTPVASAAVATLAPRPRALPGESTASARKASASIAASTSRPAIPAAAATVAQAPAAIVTGPSSAEGTWLGVLSCSALIPAQEFQGKPFVARIVVDVKGPHVSWVRSDKMFTETVQGTIDASGNIAAAGEGIYADKALGRWRVEAKGEYRPRESRIDAAVLIRRGDSSVARECTLRAERASASSVATQPGPTPALAVAATAARPAPVATGIDSLPADGSWLGVLSCSALIPAQEFQGKPFVARIVVDVKGPHVSWVRSDKMFTETVQGTIDAAGHIVATGEGNEIFDDGRRGRWRVELKGEFRPREHLVGAAVQMRRWSDSSLARECTLRAEHS